MNALGLGLPFARGQGYASPGGGYPRDSMASFIADFANDRYFSRDQALNGPWVETSDPFTTSSGANGTRVNSSGVLELVSANTKRRTYDPTSLLPLGIITEEPRTNRFLNALLNGTSLTTQTVTVTNATVYTVSFYGTGSITLSGGATQVVSGSSAYPTRTTYTFTSSTTSVLCTVSGSVQFAQFEQGAYASSFIPTAGSTVARAVDLVSRTLGAEFNAAALSQLVVGIPPYPASTVANINAVQFDDGSNNNVILTYRTPTGGSRLTSTVASVAQSVVTAGTWAASTSAKIASAYANLYAHACQNGGAVGVAGVAPAMPTLTTMRIGRNATGTSWNGIISLLVVYPLALDDASLQAIST